MLTPKTSAPAISADGAPRRLTRGQIAPLVLIAALGLAIRLTTLYDALQSPGYKWEDPDRYVTQALRLAGDGHWRWTFDAVTYAINNQRHALPPMYLVFLSILFALFPGFPLTAQIAQVVLSIASILLVFALGRRLHSASSGLIAAAAVCALGAEHLQRLVDVAGNAVRPAHPRRVPPAGARARRPGTLARLSDRGAGIRRGGFDEIDAALLRPAGGSPARLVGRLSPARGAAGRRLRCRLCAADSALFSRAVATFRPDHHHRHAWQHSPRIGLRHAGAGPLRNRGGSLACDQRRSRQPTFRDVSPARGPCSTSTAAASCRIHVVAQLWASALIWKTIVHLGADLLLIVGVILAAPGAVLSRRRNLAVFLLLWAAINIGIASLGGFGGARLRAPFEPLLAILAAVVFAGAWQRPRPAALAAAIATGAVAAMAVLPQVPASLRSWPDYGMAWPSILSRPSGTFTAAAGLNVPAFDGRAAFDVTSNAQFPTRLEIRVGGVHVNDVALAAGETKTIRTMWPARGLAYIELDQQAPANQPAVIAVTVRGR